MRRKCEVVYNDPSEALSSVYLIDCRSSLGFLMTLACLLVLFNHLVCSCGQGFLQVQSVVTHNIPVEGQVETAEVDNTYYILYTV